MLNSRIGLKRSSGLKSGAVLSKSSLKRGSGIKSRDRAGFSINREAISRDDLFYLSIWDSRPHYCEECGLFLGDDVVDDNGRVEKRIYFSHILPKGGLYTSLRHHPKNMNLMCPIHHEQWEDQHKRKNMKIYPQNLQIIGELLEIVNGKKR